MQHLSDNKEFSESFKFLTKPAEGKKRLVAEDFEQLFIAINSAMDEQKKKASVRSENPLSSRQKIAKNDSERKKSAERKEESQKKLMLTIDSDTNRLKINRLEGRKTLDKEKIELQKKRLNEVVFSKNQNTPSFQLQLKHKAKRFDMEKPLIDDIHSDNRYMTQFSLEYVS